MPHIAGRATATGFRRSPGGSADRDGGTGSSQRADGTHPHWVRTVPLQPGPSPSAARSPAPHVGRGRSGHRLTAAGQWGGRRDEKVQPPSRRSGASASAGISHVRVRFRGRMRDPTTGAGTPRSGEGPGAHRRRWRPALPARSSVARQSGLPGVIQKAPWPKQRPGQKILLPRSIPPVLARLEPVEGRGRRGHAQRTGDTSCYTPC
jgi:hypothetical protein